MLILAISWANSNRFLLNKKHWKDKFEFKSVIKKTYKIHSVNDNFPFKILLFWDPKIQSCQIEPKYVPLSGVILNYPNGLKIMP